MTVHSWTEDEIARAAGMKRAGFSHAAIGDRLGLTASAARKKMLRIRCYAKLDGKGGYRSVKQNRGPLGLDRFTTEENL